MVLGNTALRIGLGLHTLEIVERPTEPWTYELSSDGL